MEIVYPNLTAEIARRGIKKSAIADALHISGRSLQHKMTGDTQFSWPEVCLIHEVFFPDLDKDVLFRTAEQEAESGS